MPLLKERKYSIKQLAEHFAVSAYHVEQMMLRGELEQPLPRQNTSQNRYWTQSQVTRCEEKLYLKSLPSPNVKPFRFTKKTEAQISAYYERRTA